MNAKRRTNECKEACSCMTRDVQMNEKRHTNEGKESYECKERDVLIKGKRRPCRSSQLMRISGQANALA